MGKPLSNNEILNYLKTGWNFHRKPVNDYAYLIRRKGQLTRSHGAFKEKDWIRINSVKQQWINGLGTNENETKIIKPEMTKTRIKAIKTINRLTRSYTKELSFTRGVLKTIFCKSKNNGFCQKWIFFDNDRMFKHLDTFHKYFGETREDYAKNVVDDEGTSRWLIAASTNFCETCSLFEPDSRYTLNR